MRRTSLTAMLTLAATVAATVAMAGCGGKSGAHLPTTSTTGSPATTTTSTVHKHATKPGY